MSENPFRPPGSPRSMLSGLTHELRTPLNSILIMAEFLVEAEEDLGEREARYARNIRQAAQDLLELVNQAGEIGRIESGRQPVESRTVALADLARRIQEEQRDGETPTGGRLTVSLAPDAPETVVTDPAKLVRAVGLVLTAALRASKEGDVTAALAPLPGASGVEVTVTDSGPALTEAEGAALFVPFAGAGPRTARRFGGTGLGLTIAWALARLLGGELSAEPAGETGCRFRLTAPDSSH
jgi:signal transduction histidine kinase